jgi:hypothetical protein
LFTNRVQLVQEGGDEASRSTNMFLGGGVLGCDLIHEKAGENGEEFVGAVNRQEGREGGAEGAAGLG